jgi:hypothetical protein
MPRFHINDGSPDFDARLRRNLAHEPGVELMGVIDRPDGMSEVHVWVPPPPAPRTHDGHRRGRDTEIPRYDGDLEDPNLDASAAGNGEWNPASDPGRYGGPDDPPERGGPNGERAPETGGVQEPLFVDARSLRLRGRDQNGKMFEAAIYGGANPQGQSWNRNPIGDRHTGLLVGATDDHVAQLGWWQETIRAYWNARR